MSVAPSPHRSVPPSDDRHVPLRAYFGHHKCATGWIGGTIRELAHHLNWNFRIVNRPCDFEAYESLGAFVEDHGIEVLSYANANITHARTLPLYRGIHVVRDPRDVLVSGYFSHRKTHDTNGWPDLLEHRARLQSLSKEEGLLAEMEFSAPFFRDMRTWDYEQEHVLELRMEDVTAHPEEAFFQIAEFLELLDLSSKSALSRFAHRIASLSNRWNRRGRRFMPGGMPMFPVPTTRLDGLSPDLVREVVAARSFEKLTGRKKGQENRNTHLRKGVPGDWANHFSEVHVQQFKDRYGDLVLKLGYEETPDW